MVTTTLVYFVYFLILVLTLLVVILFCIIKYLNVDLLQIGSASHREIDEYILEKLIEKIHLMYFRGIRLANALAEQSLISKERRDDLINDFTSWKSENRLIADRGSLDLNLKLPDPCGFSDIQDIEWQSFLKEVRTISRVAVWIRRLYGTGKL